MVNEPGEISAQNIKAVLAKTGTGPIKAENAMKAVGSQRPNATPIDLLKRKADLQQHRETKEYWTGTPPSYRAL